MKNKIIAIIAICIFLATSSSRAIGNTQNPNNSVSSILAPLQHNQSLTGMTSSEVSFDGKVIKGIISNAIIKAYPVVEKNGTYQVDYTSPPLLARTKEDGGYQVKPSKRLNNRYFYIEMTTDSESKMMCDFHIGCHSILTGDYADFGELIPLPENFVLSNIVQTKAGKISNAPISPLTHLLVNYAKTLPKGLSSDNITKAKQYIEETFGLRDNALTRVPTDITALSKIDNLKEDDLYLGILSAAFAPYIEQQNWDDPNNLPLEKLFSYAKELTQFLFTQTSSGMHLKRLAAIETIVETQYNLAAAQLLQLRIIEHPQSVEVEVGSSITLSIVAEASDNLSYQWLKDNVAILGANSSNLAIENVGTTNEGSYSITVSNSSQSITSQPAYVTVTTAPAPSTRQGVSIISQPESIVTREGEFVSLSVGAVGDEALIYQWQKGGSIIPGASGDQLTFNPIQLSDGGTYSISVSNSFSSVQSDFAMIAVNTAIAPITITKPPSNTSVVEGGGASFSVTATGGGYLAYLWRKDGVALPNAYQAMYVISETNLSDSGNYDVVISNSVGNAISSTAVLDVIPIISPVTIQQHPVAQSINEGESLSLSVSTIGGGNITYNWYKDGIAIPGTDSSVFSITQATTADQGNYFVNVSNEVSNTNSHDMYLTVVPAPVTSSVLITLSWDIPTHRIDGSELAISDIAGYQIIYGTDTYLLDQTIEAANAQITSIDLDLIPGTYYFQIATKTIDGMQSQFSESVAVDLK